MKLQWLTASLVVFVIAVGTVRCVYSGVLPGAARLAGDFEAVFPSEYFAALRPDWPPPLVWRARFPGDPAFAGRWHYGPMLHFLTIPLFLVPRQEHIPIAWTAINVAAVFATFGLALTFVRPGQRGLLATGTIAGLWLGFQPLVNCLAQGNIEIVEIAILVAALALLNRSREKHAGALLGAAAMIKALPAGFIAWLALRRMWGAVAAALLTIVAIAIATEATLGWKNSQTIANLPRQVRVFTPQFHDLSVAAIFLHQTATVRTNSAGTPVLSWDPNVQRAAQRAGQLASALLLLFYAYLLWRRRHNPFSPYEMSVLFLLMFLVAPIGHDYYLVFALVPLTVAWLTAVAERRHVHALAIIAAYLMMSPPLPFGWIDRQHWFELPFAYLWNFRDIPTFGALLLLGLTTSRWLADPVDAARSA